MAFGSEEAKKIFKPILVEETHRCSDVTIDDTFAVPSGQIWYVKNIYITTGNLYLDGEVKIVG